MDHGTVLILGTGATALVAIVGIYYIWVRKLSDSEPAPADRTPSQS